MHSRASVRARHTRTAVVGMVSSKGRETVCRPCVFVPVGILHAWDGDGKLTTFPSLTARPRRPCQLEMEDEDTIDVFQQQTGGSRESGCL